MAWGELHISADAKIKRQAYVVGLKSTVNVTRAARKDDQAGGRINDGDARKWGNR